MTAVNTIRKKAYLFNPLRKSYSCLPNTSIRNLNKKIEGREVFKGTCWEKVANISDKQIIGNDLKINATNVLSSHSNFLGQLEEDTYTSKSHNSFLIPPNIPGIRRAPRIEKEPPHPATLNRMKIPLPPIGSRMRKYIDPRLDLAAPFITTALFIWPFAFFQYF